MLHLTTKERPIWLSLVRASIRAGTSSDVAGACADSLIMHYRQRCKPEPKIPEVPEAIVARVSGELYPIGGDRGHVLRVIQTAFKVKAEQSPDPSRPEKLRCIKTLRQETGLGLRESKFVMDAVFEHSNIRPRS